jgi:hypothetical protein
MKRRAALAGFVFCLVTQALGYAKVTDFAGQGGMNEAVLSWRTITENENLGFNLYRSLFEGGPYQQVNAQLIPGAGTSTIPHDYTYTDTDFGRGTSFYYKLEDVDASGGSTMHGPIEVEVTSADGPGGSGPETLELGAPVPCPADDRVQLRCRGEGTAELRITNANGWIRREQTVRLEGTATVSLSLRGVDPGTYVVSLRLGGVTATRRLVVAR